MHKPKFRVAIPQDDGSWEVHEPPHLFRLSSEGSILKTIPGNWVRSKIIDGEVMLYTGLTDDENTDIYQGDYISYDNTAAPKVPPQLIVWSKKECSWARYHPEYYDQPFPFDESLQDLTGLRVVGDKFRNPDLVP